MTLLLVGAFAWSTGLGFMTLGVPLYAYHLGFSGVAIGSVVALPHLLHLVMRLLGGALLDRIGERRLLLVSYGALIGAGPVFFVAGDIRMLIAAQLLAMVSRSTYWISVQTYASRAAAGRNVNLGWLSATNNAGQILGMACAGVLITLVGFATSFLVLSALGLVALASALALRPLTAAAQTAERRPAPFVHFPQLLATPAIHCAILCSFLGALPLTLTGSFFAVYLATIGADPESTGAVSALRGVGAVASGLLLARFLGAGTRLPLTLAMITVYAALIGFTPQVPDPWLMAPVLLALGMGSALMELTSQLSISEASSDRMRGSAMALGSLGYNISFLLVPLFFGYVSDRAGLDAAFNLAGLLLLILLPLAVVLHRAGQSARQAPHSGP